MIDELLDYIFRATPPERATVYKDALILLRQIDPQSLELILNTFAGNAENFDTAMNVNSFHTLLINNLSDQIEQFGVYLNDDADYYNNVPLLYAILHGLYLLEHYDNMGELRVVLDTGHHSRQVLGELLGAVESRVSFESYVDMVEDVSPSLIARINDMVDDRLQFQFDESTTPDLALRDRARAAVDFYKTQGLSRYVEEGGNLGDPLSAYLDYFYFELQSVPTDHASRMFLTLAVFANIPEDQVDDSIGQALSSVFADMPADRMLAQARDLKKQPRLGVSNEKA